MVGHYVPKSSSAARWCERFAAIGVPYFVVTILLHRTGQVGAPQVFWLIGFGSLLPLVSLSLGVRAFFDLWYSGLRGGMAAARGIFVSTILLAPFLWLGYLSFVHPAVNDVASDPFAPPPFLQAADTRAPLVPKGANALSDYDAAYAAQLTEAYPELSSRRYNSGAERILVAVSQLVESRGWQTVATRGVSQAGKAIYDQPADTQNVEEGELNSGLPQDIYIEVVARTPVFGFRQDIVIAIVSEAETTLVDMRASTRWVPHDFGRNARTITGFLLDLDKALIGIAGEG